MKRRLILNLHFMHCIDNNVVRFQFELPVHSQTLPVQTQCTSTNKSTDFFEKVKTNIIQLN